MVHSIFDPAGGETVRSGSLFKPPETGMVDFQPPAETPAIDVSTENDGKLLVIRITGKLHKSDYAHFVPMVEKAVRENGKVRMLLQLHHFHGWDACALWEDVKFDVKHFKDIERLAIVGETTWEKLMAAFCKPFTTATIRYFPSEQAAEAREWVTAA
jgi:hypothetical protein